MKKKTPAHKVVRVFSTNCPSNIMESDEKCFVPYSDFLKLEKRFKALHGRYRRESNRKVNEG